MEYCQQFEDDEIVDKIKFKVVGIVTSVDFQQCRSYTEKLYKNVGKIFLQPDIRPLLDVAWAQYKTKLRREEGGRAWETDKDVAVYVNDEYIGDTDDMMAFITKTFSFRIVEDFGKNGEKQLIDIIETDQENGLYTDLVPRTSQNFKRLCRSRSRGYLGSPIHRVAKESWIQGGGYSIPKRRLPDENYVIRHDRRGVLSMANAGRHKKNSTQFIISLEATPWMDRRYVGFGQLVQGEQVLKLIERVHTHYEHPVVNLRIVAAGEFSLYPTLDEEAMRDLNQYLEAKDELGKLQEDILHPRDVESTSIISLKLLKGCYALETDLRSYLPFIHLPDYLLDKYLAQIQEIQEEEEGGEEVGLPFTFSYYTTEPTSETALPSAMLSDIRRYMQYMQGTTEFQG